MATTFQITIDGRSFPARRGELLLDAALGNGIDLPYRCRAGHCGTCCVRLLSGEVEGGEGSEPGIVHACQCRIAGHAVVECARLSGVRTVEGRLASLRTLSPEVMEVGIRTDRVLPYLAGQYAELRFAGYPGRPFSITHPLPGREAGGRLVFFHVRRMEGGCVSPALGKRIRPGHRVTLTGPYGSAHFRPERKGRIVLVATSTGFAPIWSIAVAALRENPERRMMVIAGGRSLSSLYMAPALVELARFPKVRVLPVCSARAPLPLGVMPGRPTGYMPRLIATDTLYACGAPGMVEGIKAIAAEFGAQCYADPFLPSVGETVSSPPRADGPLNRAVGWIATPASRNENPHTSGRPRTQPVERGKASGMTAAR